MNYPGGGEGNVLIAVGNNATTVNYWLFDNDGNLTLPSNAFAINYANGIQVSLGGGNVTWAQLGNKDGASGPTIIALGQNAGFDGQGNAAIAIGQNAGAGGQGASSITIGQDAGGNTTQGANAVAIGKSAGFDAQGTNSIAIGANAGITSQANNSIILNATGANLNQTTANTFTVAPVRNDVANIAEVMFYNNTSKEVTYGNTISVAGNITGAYILGNGSGLTSLPIPTVTQDITSNGAMSIMTYDGNLKYVNNATVEPSTGNIAGGNISTTGQITSTKAGNLSNGGGQLYLNGSGNNRIDFNTNGTGAPTFTTRSAGTKVVLYPSIGASATDYAMGVDAGALWSGIPAADGGQFFKWYAGTTEVANLSGTGMLTVTGNISGANISTSGNLTLPNSSVLTFGDTPVTNRYYVDATRTDTYTENGSQARPFKTIAGAQAAIATAIIGGLNPQVEPIYIILLSNITENVSLTVNHVYLIGQNGQIHQPIILFGDITVNPTSGTLNTNHFSITGLEVVGTTNGKAIYVTGTSPLRLSLQDVWITANGTGAGLYQDNSGSGTYTHGGPLKVSHNGSGDVYCFDIRNGTASFDTVETSGATQVGAAGPGATLTFNNSQLDANGDVVVETYGNGVLVVTNSAIKNSQANGYGIKLNAVANVAGTVSVGQSAFNVPTGTGQAVWLDPNTTVGLSGVFAWAGVSFYPGTNTTINPSIIPAPLTTLVGTIAAPIIVGDITATGTAQDWDLIDNNASALSFDTTGKAGIINIVTTNSSEGVTMSGTLSVTGNANVGNLNTTTAIITTGNITTINSGLLQNGNSNITITSNGNVSIQAAGSTVELVVTSTGANITGTLTSTGKIGYASGSTVTQTSNRGNGVNIDALAGTIVTVSASMTAGEIGAFSVTNNQVDTTNDIVLVQVVSPNLGNYNVIANPNSGIGGFYLTLQNISGFPISAEAVTIRFMVIKAPNA
jgi:hypothetical protein